MKGVLQLKHTVDKFDINVCIICQEDGRENLTTSKNGRSAVMAAAGKRRGIVWDRLNARVVEKEFKHHINNKCYKSYTHAKALKKFNVCCFLFCFVMDNTVNLKNKAHGLIRINAFFGGIIFRVELYSRWLNSEGCVLIGSNLILFDFSKRKKISSFLQGSITLEPKDVFFIKMRFVTRIKEK